MYPEIFDGSAWDWVLMTIGMVVMWSALVVGLLFVLRAVGTARAGRAPHEPSHEALPVERFAHGEVDETEYRELLAVLRRQYDEDMQASTRPEIYSVNHTLHDGGISFRTGSGPSSTPL